MTDKKANKAAVYSALIFPGAGLWWLKRYSRACIFMIPAAASLWFLLSSLMNYIAPVYNKMLRDSQEGLINVTDFSSIYSTLHNEIYQSIAAHQSQLQFAEIIFVTSWMCSIASSYFAGKKLDQEKSINPH